MSLLLTLLGGLSGAALRYGAERGLRSCGRHLARWGTFALNAAGCFLLGALAGWAHLHRMTGVLILLGGAVTAYSVAGYDNGRLALGGRRGPALRHVLTGWCIGLPAAAMGVFVSLN
ncbi:FluC/FEX family fluoride channel [Streptomyces pinistramenti]|uniref:FluC/FEX family fluoride channel n=1 Tax=Streptomyces pinistramenti TaxID=2884812 RepID=UPI001D0744D4|nr:CrcB family protein [Streptomyces pinistramenti]MCB5909268.1 CrcB family protein [Streptomyces pinistramenti]